MKSKKDVESKQLADKIAGKLFKLFDVDRFRNLVRKFIGEKYGEGIDGIEKQLQINVDFASNTRNLSMLDNYVFDNIKGVTEEMQEDLRQELQRGIMENDSAAGLKKRVADIFRGKNPTRFNFQNRMKMIVRTEGKRAINMAKYQGAMDSRRPLYKYLQVKMDGRTSEICRKEHAKYGEKSLAIPMRKKFTVNAGGKDYTAQYPPFHPNCRSSVVITQNPKEKL